MDEKKNSAKMKRKINQSFEACRVFATFSVRNFCDFMENNKNKKKIRSFRVSDQASPSGVRIPRFISWYLKR